MTELHYDIYGVKIIKGVHFSQIIILTNACIVSLTHKARFISILYYIHESELEVKTAGEMQPWSVELSV